MLRALSQDCGHLAPVLEEVLLKEGDDLVSKDPV
jgi:hypothetical protein